MGLKPNYLIIPLIAVTTALFGGAVTGNGMDWYNYVLIRPEITPPKWIFPVVWNFIFLCTTISALIIWNHGKYKKSFLWELLHRKNPYFWWTIGLFISNAVLNVFWSFLFSNLHLLTAAFIEMFFLEATVVALTAMTYKTSKIASALLLPYGIWVAFAGYLTYQIVVLN